MSDPFKEQHAREQAAAEKAARDAATRQNAQQIQANIAAAASKANKPLPIPHPWPKKFYDVS